MVFRSFKGALGALACATAMFAAHPNLDEGSLELSFEEQGVEVRFDADFAGDEPCAGAVEAAWIDVEGDQRASSRTPLVMTPGRSEYALRLPVPGDRLGRQLDAFWDRLRFRFEPAGSQCLSASEQIVSVSRARAGWFRLELAVPDELRSRKVPVAVRAVHPVSGEAIAGIRVDAALWAADLEREIVSDQATTDASGAAAFTFELPAEYADDERLEVRASATHGSLTATQETIVWAYLRGEALLATDKPIYQPGETIRIRTVIFGRDGRAIPNAQGTIEIHAHGDELQRFNVTSNRFGVAAAEYELGEHAELGRYWIGLELFEPEELEVVWANRQVTVTRYERPPFEVSATPATASFRPGETITLDVAAVDFVGKPLIGGLVEVRELERNEDSDEDAPVVRGELDQEGRASVAIVGREDTLNRRFEVTVEDPLSRRVERDEVKVAVAKRPIRLRVAGLEQPFSSLGTRAYVRAENRDGTPVAGRLKAYRLVEQAAHEIWSGETTAAGTAVVDLQLTGPLNGREIGRLRFDLEDAQGRRGRKHVSIDHYDDEATLRLRTDRTLYGQSEPIRLSLAVEPPADAGPTPAAPIPAAFVSVRREGEMLAAHAVTFTDGRAELAIGPSQEFHGLLAIEARIVDAYGGEIADVVRFIEFPERTELRVSSSFDRDSYRPGDPVRAKFAVTGLDGKPVEAAIGVAAVDAGILRRAETLGVVGEGTRSPVAALSEHERQIHAEVLLNSGHRPYFNEWEISLDLLDKPNKIYRDTVARSAAQAKRLLQAELDGGAQSPPYVGAVREILRRRGLDWDQVLDPWGNPSRLRFAIERGEERLHVRSAGPDEVFDTPDDVWADLLHWPYFDDARRAVSRALAASPSFPENDEAFHAAMRAANVEEEFVSDPWGRPYRTRLSLDSLPAMTTADYFWYSDFSGDPRDRNPDRLRDLWTKRRVLTLVSDGPSGDESFAVARFYDTPESQARRRMVRGERPARGEPAERASLTGILTDTSGASIPGGEVTAEHVSTGQVFETQTDDSGTFLFDDLTPGLYQLQLHSDGFRSLSIYGVPVHERFRTRADAYLEIGQVTETVAVMAEAASLQTATTSMAEVIESETRVRRDFPETLLWAPFVETDASGHAELRFEAADQITTWQVEAFATALDGRRRLHKTSLEVFQPVYLDYDPPPVLTLGDRVDVPVLIRNYLEEPIRLKASVDARGGVDARLLDDRRASVEPGESVARTVALAVEDRSQEARQIVSVSGAAADAIEKSVRVRGPGEKRYEVYTLAALDGGELAFELPKDAIEGSIDVDLRVFPDLASHVEHALDALLTRPYGCGEQTISSTFPNALALGILADSGRSDSDFAALAKRNLEAGYRRLLSYRAPSGGIRYFAGREPDAALTAYALEFFEAASERIEIDSEVVEDAEDWLLERVDQIREPSRTLVLGVLARNGHEAEVRPRSIQTLDADEGLYAEAARLRLLAALDDRRGATDAADRVMDAFDSATGPTPFYGGGDSARTEALGLAAKGLAEARAIGVKGLDARLEQAVGELLRLKDQDGLWPSTQAVIRALIAFRAVSTEGGEPVEIRLNGRRVRQTGDPGEAVDVGERIQRGVNRVRLRADGWASAQIIVRYAVPWSDSPREHPRLALDVDYERTELAIGDTVEVRVRAGRKSGSGGMLIAEIGLPPGAEVDRATLEGLPGVYRYDVLPDAVIFYVWRRAEQPPEEFRFRFRPRLAMDAVTAPSRLYDYYDPEQSIARKPARFRVGRYAVDRER